MLVGFPVAFYMATLIAYSIYGGTGNRFWFQLGVVANIAGVIGAVLAAIPGFLDWALGIPSGHPAKTTGFQHLILNVAALAFFGTNAYLQFPQWDALEPMAGAAIALAAGGMAMALGAGFLGWKMVQRYHVGVDLTAEQARIDRVTEGRPAGIGRHAFHSS